MKNSFLDYEKATKYFCGNYNEWVDTKWKHGASLWWGKYFNIDQDKYVVHIDAPQDARLRELNMELNATYVLYGDLGQERAVMQEEQDKASSSYGISNLAKRVVTKSSKNYSNESWDLVDALDQETVSWDELEKDDFPENMQNMTDKEREAYVEEQRELREEIQSEIGKLSVEREEYIFEQKQAMNIDTDTLDQVIFEIINEQLKDKGFNIIKY